MANIFKYIIVVICLTLFVHVTLYTAIVWNNGFINAKLFSEIGENLGSINISEVQAVVKLLLDNCT